MPVASRNAGASGAPHPLLSDWFDVEPEAVAEMRSVLVVGSAADARMFRAAAHVEHVGTVEHLPGGGTFDVVAAIDCLADVSALRTALAALAAAVGPGGRLLIITVGAPDGPSPDELSPLSAAGLALVSFDDMTDGSMPGGVPGDRSSGGGRARRWLRAVYVRPPHEDRDI
ncbi:MAG TPA: hypothetical protein VH395_16350 [Jatrophihabitantaceae bacterium]